MRRDQLTKRGKQNNENSKVIAMINTKREKNQIRIVYLSSHIIGGVNGNRKSKGDVK